MYLVRSLTITYAAGRFTPAASVGVAANYFDLAVLEFSLQDLLLWLKPRMMESHPASDDFCKPSALSGRMRQYSEYFADIGAQSFA